MTGQRLWTVFFPGTGGCGGTCESTRHRGDTACCLGVSSAAKAARRGPRCGRHVLLTRPFRKDRLQGQGRAEPPAAASLPSRSVRAACASAPLDLRFVGSRELAGTLFLCKRDGRSFSSRPPHQQQVQGIEVWGQGEQKRLLDTRRLSSVQDEPPGGPAWPQSFLLCAVPLTSPGDFMSHAPWLTKDPRWVFIPHFLQHTLL